MKLESFIALLEAADDKRNESHSVNLQTAHAILIFRDRFGSLSEATKALKLVFEVPELSTMSERADIGSPDEKEYSDSLGKLNSALGAANSAVTEPGPSMRDAHAAIAHLVDACEALKAMIVISRRRS